MTRAFAFAPELRDERRLCFYAAVFNAPAIVTEFGETFREVIKPGAFTRALVENTGIYACVEHDPARTFATRDTGLLMQQDARGLFASVYLPETPVGNQVLADVKDGKYRGASFKFFTWEEAVRPGSPKTVEVIAADLREVCLTASPVYSTTVVSVRSRTPVDRERRVRLLKLRT